MFAASGGAEFRGFAMPDRRRPTVEGGSPELADSTFSLHQSNVDASFGRTQGGYQLSFARDGAVVVGAKLPALR